MDKMHSYDTDRHQVYWLFKHQNVLIKATDKGVYVDLDN